MVLTPRPCSRCKKKPEHISRSGKRRSWCITCLNTYNKRLAAEKPEQYLAARRRRHLATKYGLTLDDYDARLQSQGGGCDICGALPKTTSLPVDHDEETGRVRGILCGACNRGIGQLGHSPERLESAAAYLRRNGWY